MADMELESSDVLEDEIVKKPCPHNENLCNGSDKGESNNMVSSDSDYTTAKQNGLDRYTGLQGDISNETTKTQKKETIGNEALDENGLNPIPKSKSNIENVPQNNDGSGFEKNVNEIDVSQSHSEKGIDNQEENSGTEKSKAVAYKDDFISDKASPDDSCVLNKTRNDKELDTLSSDTEKKQPEGNIKSTESNSIANYVKEKPVVKPQKYTIASKSPVPPVQMRPMATLLFDVGMDLARQQVYKDLIRIQSKKQSMDKLDEKETKQLDKLREAYDELVSKNEPFACDVQQCDTCGYKTEVDTVMENHMEYGHGQSLGLFQCSLCEFESKVQHQFIVHMDKTHGRKGRILVRHAFFVCPFCPFEHNAKNSFNKHIIKCEKLFKLYRNLEPTPADCDIPIKLPKPPAQLMSKQSGKQTVNQRLATKRQLIPNNAQAVQAAVNPVVAAQQAVKNIIRSPTPAATRALAPNQQQQMVQVGNQWYHMIHLNGQRFLTPVVQGVAVPNVMVPTPAISPPQHGLLPTPNQVQTIGNKQSNGQSKNAFEICEICGGFVKDRDSLRIHFYWAHKVDIHKDVFTRKLPNISCEHCTFRCWTTQGLARHKSASHKEQSKNKDKQRLPFYCMLCRPTPELLHTETFWLHMFHQHTVSTDNIFNQAHCVVCGVANIGVPNALETHMLNIHGHLFADDLLTFAKKIAVKLNFETFQSNEKKQCKKDSVVPMCSTCDMSFRSLEEYANHCQKMHVFKCSRCPQKWGSRDYLMKHFHDSHKDEKDPCPLCDREIQIGRPLVRHMKSEHMRDCSIVLQRLPQTEVDKHMDKFIATYGELQKLNKNPSKSRKRVAVDQDAVIILDDTPQKKARKENDQETETTTNSTTKEVIEFDGEEFVVEIQQNEDYDEDAQHNESGDDQLKSDDVNIRTIRKESKIVCGETAKSSANDNSEAIEMDQRSKCTEEMDSKDNPLQPTIV